MLDLENPSPGPDYKVSQTSITLFVALANGFFSQLGTKSPGDNSNLYDRQGSLLVTERRKRG